MATPELRHMLRDDDLNHEEQKQVLELAIKFHKDRFYHRPFAGPQGIAVIFDKPSTRTRSSFSIGVAELGGYPLVIDKSGSQLGRGEPVADTARVLDRMAYGVVWRTFGQDRVEEMAKYSTHPVVNALTDEFHPCQILADFQTIAEHRGGVDNLKNQTIAYLGDAANNMANSYLLGGAVAGMNVRVAGPYGYLPDPQIVADAEAIAAENGGSILVTTDPKEAVAGADCVFTDTWVSMGEEAEYAVRSKPFWDYQVNADLWPRPRTMPSSSIACPHTVARKSPPRSSTARSPWSGMRLATVCMRRRRCLPGWLARHAATKACWHERPHADAASGQSCRSTERHRTGVADPYHHLAGPALVGAGQRGHRGHAGYAQS